MKILGRLTRILGTLLKRFLNLLNFITQFRDSTSSDTAGARDGAEDEFSLRNFCRAFLQWAALPNFHNILAIPSLTLSLPQSQSPFTTGSVQINQLSGRAHTQLDYDSSWCNSTYGWHGKVLFNRHELDFQKVLSPKSFKQFVDQLCLLHRSALWEVCREYTEPGCWRARHYSQSIAQWSTSCV